MFKEKIILERKEERKEDLEENPAHHVMMLGSLSASSVAQTG